MGHESIIDIANGFLKDRTVEQVFREKFQTDLPEVLNERHRIYIIASSLDSATERIVKYLSETHDVDINVATFAYFRTNQGELLGRSLLLDEAEVQTRAESKSKRKPPRSWEELRGLAEQSGVVDLYDKALDELPPLFDGMNRTRTNVALVGYMGENKSRNVIIGVYPEASISDQGLAIMFFLDRLREYFDLTEDQIKPILSAPAKDAPTYDPNSTWFFNAEQLGQLLVLLREAKEK